MTITLRQQHETNYSAQKGKKKKKNVSKPINDGKQRKFTLYKEIIFFYFNLSYFLIVSNRS